jgi:hypothetical protein
MQATIRARADLSRTLCVFVLAWDREGRRERFSSFEESGEICAVEYSQGSCQDADNLSVSSSPVHTCICMHARCMCVNDKIHLRRMANHGSEEPGCMCYCLATAACTPMIDRPIGWITGPVPIGKRNHLIHAPTRVDRFSLLVSNN